jgi:protease secretion system outer membrane protein
VAVRIPRLRLLAPLVAGALLCHSGSASALGLLEAYRAALANDPTYQAAFYANEGGKENRILGRAGLLPSVSASYSASRNNTDITTGKLVQHPKYLSRSTNIGLRQSIINLDAIARYKQGKAQADASAAQFDAARQDLIVRVVGAYIEALFADDQMALSKAQRDTLLEQKQVNDRLFKAGEGTRTDMLEVQARLDLAEAKLLEAEDNRKATLTTLSGIVGQEVTSLDGLAPQFHVRPSDRASYEEWKATALARNPELKAQELGVEVAHQEVNKQRAGHMPRLDFVANYARGSSDTLNTINQDSTVRSLGIQLNVPIYAGGAVSASTRQAQAGELRAKAELEAKKDKILLDLRKEYDSTASSVTRIEALVKATESARLLMTATTQSIKGGVRINLDLLAAQEQLYTAQRDLAQARYTYLVGLLRLRAAAGTLSADDVEEIAAYFRR